MNKAADNLLTGVTERFNTVPPDRRPDVLRSITDPIAAANFAAQRHSADWSPCFDVVIPELASCALMLLIKDESDIISQNLEHHYHLGFRYFFVMDNSSTDGTADLIAVFRAKHSDALVICVYDPVVAFYQQEKMNALQIFAQNYLVHDKPDWIFFVDADEFITCCSARAEEAKAAFQAILTDSKRKLMIFHWVQCASDLPIESINGGYEPQAVFSNRWRELSPAVPKIAFRGNNGIMTTQGNHTTSAYPFSTDQAIVMSEVGFYILHYPMRSIRQLRQKIVNCGRSYEAYSGPNNFGDHWKTYYQWFQEHGESVLLRLLLEHIKSCK